MDREKILKLTEENIFSRNNSIEEIKKYLENKYEISWGKYEPGELYKALADENIFYIQGHLIVGYDPTDKTFIDSNKRSKVNIDRMVKAVIIEDELSKGDDSPGECEDIRDPFMITGKNEWDMEGFHDEMRKFHHAFEHLRVGDLYLPPHSVIVNFLQPTDEQKKSKIVSMIYGNNINIFNRDNFIDNTIHEIGHIFWRDCLNFDEKAAWKEYFKVLKPSALYEFDWEKSSAEEVFCTIYKWFLKGLLISKSFHNILAFEDPRAMQMFEQILDRKRQQSFIVDEWQLQKDKLLEYLNPKFDITTGKHIMRKGTFDEIKDLHIPDNVQAESIDRFENGHTWIKLGKATYPVSNSLIEWDYMHEMRKAGTKKYIKKIPKAGGGYRYIYKEGENKVGIAKELKEKQEDGIKPLTQEEHDRWQLLRNEFSDWDSEKGEYTKGRKLTDEEEKEKKSYEERHDVIIKKEKEEQERKKDEEEKKEREEREKKIKEKKEFFSKHKINNDSFSEKDFKVSVLKHLFDNKYEFYGLRVNSDNPKTGKSVKVKIGDFAKESYYQPDGEVTEISHGTSALEISEELDLNDSKDNIEYVMERLNIYAQLGKEIILIGSDSARGGNDPGEIEMSGGEILSILRNG